MLCEATEAGNATTHAWAEVYLPGAGWKGFDPTSGTLAGSQHVVVAVSRHPEAATPISGHFTGPVTAFVGIEVDVKLEQLDKPYQPPEQPNLFPAEAANETRILPVVAQRQEQSLDNSSTQRPAEPGGKSPEREPFEEVST